MAYGQYRRLIRKKRTTKGFVSGVRMNYGLNKIRKFRKRYIAGIPRNTYSYKQTVDGASIAVGFSGSRTLVQGAAATNNQIVVRIQDLPQYSIFTALYDLYRINKVVIKFIPMVNSLVNVGNLASTAGPVNPGMLHTYTDSDGSSVTTLAAIEQYQTYRSSRCFSTRVHKIITVPGCNISTSNSAGTATAAINKKKQWIDCANTDINHFVGGWYLDAYASANMAQTYQIQATYYISFKNVR